MHLEHLKISTRAGAVLSMEYLESLEEVEDVDEIESTEPSFGRLGGDIAATSDSDCDKPDSISAVL